MRNELRNDLRNNLRNNRSRSRSPQEIHFREQQRYSPTDNFRNNNRREMEDEERFYMEQQQREEHFFQEREDRSPEMMRNRRNFRSRSREYYDEPLQLNFEQPIQRKTRFSPPDPNMHLHNQSQQFVGPGQSYAAEIIECAPVLYSKNANINPFANTIMEEPPKLTPSNVSWQPPPEETIIIVDPEPEETVAPKDDEPIPVFDPDNEAFNSRQFVDKLDELGKVQKWNEEELKFNFVTHLEGQAKSWQINSNRMMNPWNNVKRTFINTFPPQMDYHKKLKELMGRLMNQNESLKTYIMHKTILCNQAEIFGRRAVSCIIEGLAQHTDEVKRSANGRNLGTPEELLAYLAEVEAQEKEKVKAAIKTKISEAQAQTKPAIPPLMSEASIILAHEVAKQRLQMNANCMKEGHTSSVVPAKRQIIPKHCIEVSINGITFQGYNDLSSSCVAMREVDAKIANIQFQRHITCIRGFGNASVTALGEARVIIRVDKVMISFEISIVPNAAQDMPVVIGRNFRNHPDVRYVEAEMGISFTQIPTSTGTLQNSSFSANERLMASFNSGGTLSTGNRNQNRQMDKGRRRY